MWTGRQAQEYPVLLQDKPFALGERVVFLSEGICPQSLAIGFICREILDMVDAVGRRRRAFVRGEIADEVGPAPWARRRRSHHAPTNVSPIPEIKNPGTTM